MSVLRKKPFVEELLEALTTDEIVRLSSIINVKGEPEVVDLGLTGNNPLPSSAPASIEDRIKLINLVLSPSSVYTGILIYHSTDYCALIGTVAYENDIIKLFKLDVAKRKAEPINEKLTADELRRVIDDTMESKGAGGDKIQVGDILSDDEAAGKVITSDGEGGAEWEKVANLLPGSDVESGSVASMLGFNDDGELVKGSVPAGSVVDAALNGESENPVQNKVITNALNHIEPTQIENHLISIKKNISQADGTPIIPFIRSHMWLKNGSLYTSNREFGSTETIPLKGATSIKVFPFYKYGQEQNVGNGSFVDAEGNFVANIDNGAVWDEDHLTFEVSAPDNAYGVQLNCTIQGNQERYTTSEAAGNNKAADVYTTLNNTKISFVWLDTESEIQNGSVTLEKLSTEVQNKLLPNYDDTYKYWDSLEKPFTFEEKTLVGFGDSITAGVYNEGSGNQTTYTDSYIILFANKFNMTLINRPTGGACITSGITEVTPICDKIDEYTFANTSDEIIFIAGGTNDFNSGAPLGQLGDTQTTTFYGALDHICQKLTTDAPNSIVFFITPINLNKEESSFVNAINPLNKYRNAIWEVATKYGFNVVDGSTIGFAEKVNTPWGNLMISPNDGTHPTLKGHKLYFKGLCKKLL